MGSRVASSEGGVKFLEPRRDLALVRRRSWSLRLTRGVMGDSSVMLVVKECLGSFYEGEEGGG